MSDSPDELATVRALVATATHRLLGDTIGIDDPAWRAPSRLPGWSRGHVASHIARQADGLGRLTEWARTGQRRDMYASMQAREAEIAAGAGRPGLALQVDLDTSAERLSDAFTTLDEARAWDAEVELRGGQRVLARSLPVARLAEVVLHHIDLDVGFGLADVEDETVERLLDWSAFRLGSRAELPRLELQSDTGFHRVLGSSGSTHPVTGSSVALLGWLTGRAAPDTVQGAGDLVLPGL